MITLKPQYEERPSDDDKDESSSTQPRIQKATDEVGDDTNPDLDLSNGAPLSKPESTWAKRLAARLDAQLDDDAFGAETPVSAPTRAELQALLDTAPDVTRQQS